MNEKRRAENRRKRIDLAIYLFLGFILIVGLIVASAVQRVGTDTIKSNHERSKQLDKQLR